MDDLIGYFQALAVFFIASQLFMFFIDLIAWAVRRKHPYLFVMSGGHFRGTGNGIYLSAE